MAAPRPRGEIDICGDVLCERKLWNVLTANQRETPTVNRGTVMRICTSIEFTTKSCRELAYDRFCCNGRAYQLRLSAHKRRPYLEIIEERNCGLCPLRFIDRVRFAVKEAELVAAFSCRFHQHALFFLHLGLTVIFPGFDPLPRLAIPRCPRLRNSSLSSLGDGTSSTSTVPSARTPRSTPRVRSRNIASRRPAPRLSPHHPPHSREVHIKILGNMLIAVLAGACTARIAPHLEARGFAFARSVATILDLTPRFQYLTPRFQR